MSPFRSLLTLLFRGALAGIAALSLDLLLVLVTLGWVPLSPRFVAWYLGSGALVALGLAAVRRTTESAPRRDFAISLALLYALPIAERVHQAVEPKAGNLTAVAALLVVLAGYLGWYLGLARLLGPRLRWSAGILAAVSAAAGLAVNRNLVDYPLDPLALALDVGILLLAAGSARWAAVGSIAGTALPLMALLLVGPLVRASRREQPGSSPGEPDPAAPSVLVMVLDTLRYDVFSAVLAETVEGAAFRRSLGPAAWFSNAVATAPWTAPAVGSIMTGLYPPEHRFGADRGADRGRPIGRLSDSISTLAEVFAANGYRTEAWVTNALLHPVSGLDRGFDRYLLLPAATDKLPLLTPLTRLGLLERELYQSAGSLRRRFVRRLEVLAAADRPFFGWLHFMDPHQPLHRHRNATADPAAAGADPTERLYRGEVRYLLAELGLLLQRLEAVGIADRTLVVIVADHGEMFPSDRHWSGVIQKGRPKLEGHGHALYGELVRVPLVIRPPGSLPSDRYLDTLVSQVDLFATLIELCGLPTPAPGGDRISLAGWLAEEPDATEIPRRSSTLSSANQYGPPMRALRTNRFALIHFPTRAAADELYDLAQDPLERVNRIAREGPELSRLRHRFGKLWAALDIPADDGPVDYDTATRERLEALGYL